MGNELTFSCACGQIHGQLRDIGPGSGTGAVCQCTQCRAGEVFLDQPDPTDEGVPQFHTTFDRLHLEAGAKNLYAFSFSKGGQIRWYAKCCKVPLFITDATPHSGRVVVMVDRVLGDKAPLGPIKAMMYVGDGTGRQRHQGRWHLKIRRLLRSLRMRRSGKWKFNPFFGTSGAPVTQVHVLSDVEKRHLPVEFRE